MSKRTLTAKEAIEHVIATERLSKYAIAKRMGVTPIMVDNYLRGSQMRLPTADRFEFAFSIAISDAL